MWRRFGINQTPAVETTSYQDPQDNDGYLETINEVDSIISRQNSVSVRNSTLPQLPFRALETPQPPHNRSSSVYSEEAQTTPTDPHAAYGTSNDAEGLHRYDSVRSEVSSMTPRSSVDHDSSGSPQVSPISTQFPERDRLQKYNPPRGEPAFRNQLPRLVPSETKAPQFPQTTIVNRKPAPGAVPEIKQDTKWDDYSGEATDSEAGKPATVKPGVPLLELQYPQLKERTKQILAGLRERDPSKKQAWTKPLTPPNSAADPIQTQSARKQTSPTLPATEVVEEPVIRVPAATMKEPAKKKAWGKTPTLVDSLDAPPQREPWKGASGRTTLVEPVRNNPAARLDPLKIPQRNISMPNAISNEARTQNSSPSPERLMQMEISAPTIRAVSSQDSIKPVAPLKLGSNKPRVVSPTSPWTKTVEQSNKNLESPFQSPQMTYLQPIHEIVTSPTTGELQESPTDHDEPLTPTTPTQNNSRYPPRMDNALRPETDSDGDVSRFSWTTYTTTEPGSPTHADYNSPPVPPLPAMPSFFPIRKRPMPPYTDPSPFTNFDAMASNGSVILRKPVPAAERDRSASMTNNPSLGKSLPQCPPELEAQDKISTLEARLEDLARRKWNNNKIINELSEAMRLNSISYDMKKRKEVERMIQNLNLELSEITQEEHEVGLRLHRAQKKRDKDDNYDSPTGLWIKRVTS